MGRAALLLAAGALSVPGVASATAADPAATMRLVAAAQAQAMRGVVACRSEAAATVRAPMMDKDTRYESWQISQDGVPVRVVLTRLATNGKVAPEKERREAEQKINADLPAGRMRFHAPYDPRYVGDYTYAAASVGGQRAIRFTSRLRDDHHGDGTLILDTAGAPVVANLTPAKSRAQVEGATTYQFGPAGPGGAVVVTQVKLAYRGSMGPLNGAFTMTQSMSQFRRFASVEAAVRQLGH